MEAVTEVNRINKASFYLKLKSSDLTKKLNKSQVQGFDAIINEYDRLQLNDVRKLSYIMATVWHECAKTMQPIEEYGKGKGRKYGLKIMMSGKAYTTPNKLYYGRGFVQLTWYENYYKAGGKLGIDLLNNPELALNLEYATKILFSGMLEGWFTGHRLRQFIEGDRCDYLNARRVINGLDSARNIKDYAEKFEKCLSAL